MFHNKSMEKASKKEPIKPVPKNPKKAAKNPPAIYAALNHTKKIPIEKPTFLVQTNIHKGVRDLCSLRSRITAIKALLNNEKTPSYFGKDSKDGIVMPDKKDLALATQGYDILLKDVRSLAQGLFVQVSLADVPQFIASTAGGIAGQTLYWDDVQATTNFTDWKTVFDTFRLCGVHTVTCFQGFNANVPSGNYSVWTFATDIDNSGTSSTGQTTPTMTTLAGYPYNGPTPTVTIQAGLEPTKIGGSHTQYTSWRKVPQSLVGNDSTHTKVSLGMWVNCTGNATIIAGAHLSAFFIGAVSINVATYFRRYDCEFTSGT